MLFSGIRYTGGTGSCGYRHFFDHVEQLPLLRILCVLVNGLSTQGLCDYSATAAQGQEFEQARNGYDTDHKRH